MESLEAKLKALPLRAPSPELDARVMAQKPDRPPSPKRAPRRVPAWAAASIAVLMGLAGFLAGMAWRGQQPVASQPPPQPPVTVQVLYNAPASGNPFDFTRASDIFPAGELETTIRTEKGTET